MDYQAFYAQLKRKEIRRLYLFEGEEEYSKESALKTLRAALSGGPMAMLNESLLSNPDEGALIAVCETLPVLQERRLVIVRDTPLLMGKAKDSEEEEAEPDARQAGGDILVKYLDRLPDTVCLVFFVRGKANGTRKLYKKIKELGGIVSFDQLDQERLIKWIAKELSEYGKGIDRITAEHLVFACGRELMSLKGEIAKLAAYAGEAAAVRRQDIDAVAAFSTEYKVFDLAEKVAEGKAEQAIPMLRSMLTAGEQRLMLLALLQRHYRQLLLTRIMMDEGASQATIAGELDLPGFAARRLMTSAGGYRIPQLKRAYSRCIDQEYLVKSGRINEEGSLEELIFFLLKVQQEKDGGR
jgi:DNA polymerase-3 subunit delta